MATHDTATRSTTDRDRARRRHRRLNDPCGICGQAIDYTLRTPHPDSFEVDHIHPHSKGGTFDPNNTQAAHRRCNRAKSDKTADEHDANAPRTYITDRCWW